MKNSQKGFSTLLGLLFIVLAGGGLYLYSEKVSKEISEVNSVVMTTQKETQNETTFLIQNNNPKLKSKDITKKNVTKTARFSSSHNQSNCLYLDNADIKKKFEEIVSSGTINGTYEEYNFSSIEMIANGSIEKRVYDYGKCCECPPYSECDCPICGEHVSECINPVSLDRVSDDGIKYGVNWFYGYIISSDDDIMINIDNVGDAVTKDGNGNIIKKYKYNMHLNANYNEKVLGPIATLALKNENSYIAEEDVVNSGKKFKTYGEKIQAYFCSNPLTEGKPLVGDDPCSSYQDLILVEKIINDKGENIVVQKTK